MLEGGPGVGCGFAFDRAVPDVVVMSRLSEDRNGSGKSVDLNLMSGDWID